MLGKGSFGPYFNGRRRLKAVFILLSILSLYSLVRENLTCTCTAWMRPQSSQQQQPQLTLTSWKILHRLRWQLAQKLIALAHCKFLLALTSLTNNNLRSLTFSSTHFSLPGQPTQNCSRKPASLTPCLESRYGTRMKAVEPCTVTKCVCVCSYGAQYQDWA
eukprot:1160307-Pelagomonas_calceolata.AAC.2